MNSVSVSHKKKGQEKKNKKRLTLDVQGDRARPRGLYVEVPLERQSSFHSRPIHVSPVDDEINIHILISLFLSFCVCVSVSLSGESNEQSLLDERDSRLQIRRYIYICRVAFFLSPLSTRL